MDMKALLDERGKTHGPFFEHAYYAQCLKEAYHKKRPHLCEEHLEALDMICHKIGRILAGDPYHKDHWDDIAGYALLASRAERPTYHDI